MYHWNAHIFEFFWVSYLVTTLKPIRRFRKSFRVPQPFYIYPSLCIQEIRVIPSLVALGSMGNFYGTFGLADSLSRTFLKIFQ